MIVRSPAWGFGLSRGIYCLIARRSTSSWEFDVALAYSRICWHSKVCSFISKTEDGIFVRENEGSKEGSNLI